MSTSTHKCNGKIAHSAAVNSNLKAGYCGPVLSELCLVRGFLPQSCVLSDKPYFKINRAKSCRRRRQTGNLVCVKLLQRYSRSHATLNATKQAGVISHQADREQTLTLHRCFIVRPSGGNVFPIRM